VITALPIKVLPWVLQGCSTTKAQLEKRPEEYRQQVSDTADRKCSWQYKTELDEEK